ncbi:hypothetical protein QP157_07140 [Sphingomonas sp. LR61]|uniref:hypothetical protein n=1 Tax=Sphingomonas sp. LR61 TaxID=3050234 RepID=UPI002FE3FBC2
MRPGRERAQVVHRRADVVLGTGGPAARAKLVGEFTDRLDAALPKVTNDDVHDAFEDFTEDAKEYASALTSSGSSESAEAKDAQTDVQSSLNEVSAVCPSN